MEGDAKTILGKDMGGEVLFLSEEDDCK